MSTTPRRLLCWLKRCLKQRSCRENKGWVSWPQGMLFSEPQKLETQRRLRMSAGITINTPIKGVWDCCGHIRISQKPSPGGLPLFLSFSELPHNYLLPGFSRFLFSSWFPRYFPQWFLSYSLQIFQGHFFDSKDNEGGATGRCDIEQSTLVLLPQIGKR